MKYMNAWRFCLLITIIAGNIILLGMEMRQKNEHEKTLSDIDIKIRDYFFAEDKIVNHFDQHYPRYTYELDNPEGFINSFSHAIRTSPNMATPYDESKGISCSIRPQSLVVSAALKSIIVDREYYRNTHEIGRTITAPVCSLAYTPEYIAAGHTDGSLTIVNQTTLCDTEIYPCHKGPINEVICVPSQNVFVLGGGDEITLIQIPKSEENNTPEPVHLEIEVPRVIIKLIKNEEGSPRLVDVKAVAGPFIVMQAKDNMAAVESLYSFHASNAIQHGTFSEAEKSFLDRMIDVQKNKHPVIFSDEETRIFNTLCPTIQRVLNNG
jgi:hypothetical protein